jgi:3-phosphoglycerate kinase
MSLDSSSIPQLRQLSVRRGERWIFIADFNISHSGGVLRNPGRIDCELDDARHILSAGGVIAFLAHKGRYKDGGFAPVVFLLMPG